MNSHNIIYLFSFESADAEFPTVYEIRLERTSESIPHLFKVDKSFAVCMIWPIRLEQE